MTYMMWNLYHWRVDICHTWYGVSISDEFTYNIHDVKSLSLTSWHMSYMIWCLYQWRV